MLGAGSEANDSRQAPKARSIYGCRRTTVFGDDDTIACSLIVHRAHASVCGLNFKAAEAIPPEAIRIA
jgi:hypothetical protein